MKSLLVHLDASPRAAVRLGLAQALARHHQAELAAVYGVLASLLATPWVASEGVTYAMPALLDLDRELRDRARQACDQLASSGNLRWIDGGESPYHTVLQHALMSDLVVLGQPDKHDTATGPLPPDLVPSLIIDSGRPTLVVPKSGNYEPVASRVLIAWKHTREACRALTAALPWLRQAKVVNVASRPDDADDPAVDFDQGNSIEHWLRLHGVTCVIDLHRLGPGEVGQELMWLAKDTESELLVMGCYGHSRAREWVLGGVSRWVLQGMTLPVLMVH